MYVFNVTSHIKLLRVQPTFNRTSTVSIGSSSLDAVLQREAAVPAILMLVLTGPAGLPAALAEFIVRPVAHARK